MRDEKLVSVAIKAKQPVERVLWVWGAILESAAEKDDDGVFQFDSAEAAYFLRADEADICAIVNALGDANRVAADRVVHWGTRQFKSDQSAERQSRYRDKKRAEVRVSDGEQTSGDGVVTAMSRHGDAPETETDTETERNIPPPVLEPEAPQGARDLFFELIEAYPDHPQSSESGARSAFAKLKPEDQEKAVAAAERTAKWAAQEAEERGRTLDAQLRYSKPLAKWLAEGRWKDAPKLRLRSKIVSTLPVDAIPVFRSQEELFRECETLSGETIPPYMTKKSWPAPVVAKAVANIKARASPQAVH